MKFKTLNGKTVEAVSLHGVAEAMWDMKLVKEPTLEEWMVGSAERAKMWDNSVISTASPEAHIEDLIRCGFLTPVE